MSRGGQKKHTKFSIFQVNLDYFNWIPLESSFDLGLKPNYLMILNGKKKRTIEN